MLSVRVHFPGMCNLITSNLEIARYSDTRIAVCGRLFLDGIYICDTLEPPFREKFGAIPYGMYVAKLVYSSKFKCVVPFLLVDGRYNIEIHTGNIPEHSKGCILVGYNRPYTGTSLQYSKVAFSVLMSNLESFESININVKIIYDSYFQKQIFGS